MSCTTPFGSSIVPLDRGVVLVHDSHGIDQRRRVGDVDRAAADPHPRRQQVLHPDLDVIRASQHDGCQTRRQHVRAAGRGRGHRNHSHPHIGVVVDDRARARQGRLGGR